MGELSRRLRRLHPPTAMPASGHSLAALRRTTTTSVMPAPIVSHPAKPVIDKEAFKKAPNSLMKAKEKDKGMREPLKVSVRVGSSNWRSEMQSADHRQPTKPNKILKANESNRKKASKVGGKIPSRDGSCS